MKKLLISTALFTAPLIGTVTAQTTTSTLTSLVSEQERQIQELTSEVASLRSLLNLERRKNGKEALLVSTKPVSKAHPSSASHTVKAGDTYSSISRKYGVSVSSLITSNPNVKPSRIVINQKLVIPQMNSKATTSAPKPVATPTKKVSFTSSSTQTISTIGSTYKIAKGDTFYGIAKMHKISLASLSAANPGVNPSKLKIGQSIRLTKSAASPTKATQTKPTKTQQPTNAYKPLPEVVKTTTPTKPKTVAKTTLNTTESYVQQPGDVARTVPVSHEMTFGAFAKQHGTSISVLNALNGLDLPADEPMAAGSELFIPNK
ncbi:MAG: LysM repeat protein [Cryomorphaceae bacterium]|jgi:LysM repeat protein